MQDFREDFRGVALYRRGRWGDWLAQVIRVLTQRAGRLREMELKELAYLVEASSREFIETDTWWQALVAAKDNLQRELVEGNGERRSEWAAVEDLYSRQLRLREEIIAQERKVKSSLRACQASGTAPEEAAFPGRDKLEAEDQVLQQLFRLRKLIKGYRKEQGVFVKRLRKAMTQAGSEGVF